MGHKTAQARAAYFRDWKAGIRRMKVDETGRKYIDNPVTNEVIEADRTARMRTHLREKIREQRRQDARALCLSLERDIERLKTEPFSWQREST